MNIEFIEVYSDIGAGKHGTVHGVDLISKHAKRFAHDTHRIIADKITQPPAHPAAKYIEHLLPFFRDKLVPLSHKLLGNIEQNGNFPVIISGDHSNAMGNLSAFMNHHHDARVGVVWIDAHADLHSVFTTPSGNMHGMPLAAVLRLDNTDCQTQTIDAHTQQKWQALKQLSTHQGIIPSDVFFLGLRSYEAPERHLLATQQMFAYDAQGQTVMGGDKLPLGQILSQLIDKLSQLDAVYVSFDVDALDSSLIAATGTPEPNGYQPDDLRLIFDKLLGLPVVKAFEITEFNPTLDDDSDKYRTVFDLFTHALGVIANRQAS